MALTRVAPAGIGSTPGTGYVIGDSFLHSRGVNTIDGYYTGIVTTQSLRVIGDLEVEGTTTTLDTALTEVDKLEVGANNNTVGVAITQSGTGANTIFTGGYVRVNTDVDSALELNATDDGPTYTSLRRSGTRIGYYGFGGSSNTFNITNEATNGQFNISTPSDFSITTNSAEKLRIKSDGKVGIGTNNPDEKLEVFGDIKLSQTSTRLIFEDSNSSNLSINRINSYDGAMIIDVDSNNDGDASSTFRVSIDGSERLRVDSSGNVGINTSTPSAKLNVVTTSTDDAILMLEADMGTNNNRVLQFKSPATDSSSDPFLIQTGNSIQFRIDSTDALKINDNGNIGIGTDDPGTSLLRVHGGTTLLTHASANDATTQPEMISNAALRVRPHTSNSGNLNFAQVNGGASIGLQYTNGPGTANWDIALQPFGGQVGIGTIDAGSNKLQVNGGSAFYGDGGAPVVWGDTSYLGALTFEGAAEPVVRANSGKALIFQVNQSTEALRLKSDGKSYFSSNLGLGGQTSPASAIHINNFGNDGYELKLTGNALQFNRASSSYIDQVNDSGRIIFRVTSSNTEAMRINESRKVLINSTANSNATMVVKTLTDNTHPIIKFRGTNANGYTFFGDEYQTDESQFTMGLAYSGASLVTGWGVKVSTSANDTYLSSQDTYATKHSAIKHDGNGLRFLSNSTSQTVTTNSTVTLTERLRITPDGAITVGDSSQMGSNYARISIDCEGRDVLTDVTDITKYGLAFHNDPNTNDANGIGFFNDGGDNCGGYILHQDKGSNNLGDLIFGTSATSNNPIERLRITSDGKVGIPAPAESSALLGINASSTSELSDSSGLYNQGNPCYLQIKNTTDSISDPECGIILQPRNSANGAVAIFAKRTGSYTSDLVYRVRTGSSTSAERLRIKNDGNVAIGIENPASKVHIRSTTSYGKDTYATAGTGGSQSEPPGTFRWDNNTPVGGNSKGYRAWVQSGDAYPNASTYIDVLIRNGEFYRITLKRSHSSAQASVCQMMIYGLANSGNTQYPVVHMTGASGSGTNHSSVESGGGRGSANAVASFYWEVHEYNVNTHDTIIRISTNSSNNQGIVALIEQI